MCKHGKYMYDLAEELFPIPRSITGNGVRQTLSIIKRELPLLKIREIDSGTKVFDWDVPLEWNCNDAYIITPEGKKITHFLKNNLHLVGYSVPVNRTISLNELNDHLYSLPSKENAIPYVTSYYKKNWGFCITHKERELLKDGQYKVVIDSTLEKGSLTYGEIIIPSDSGTEKEVFLSTYICHPSMANNEISGPVVTISLVKFILKNRDRRYKYRIIFIPETIGSIAYLSMNYSEMKRNIVAGFNITCVGDSRSYSYIPTISGDTLSDNALKHTLKHNVDNYITYSYMDRGSDERQYNSPGIDIPVACFCRSKYGEYPEYHTSLDNLSLLSPDSLYESYILLKKTILCIEDDIVLKSLILCEPNLGKRGLYSNISQVNSRRPISKNILDIISYCNGDRTLLEVANIIDISMSEIKKIATIMISNKLVEVCNNNVNDLY
jgi:aminopeptidase-like protein